MDGGFQVDRIFDRETIGRSWPIGPGIGVPDYAAVDGGDKIGKAVLRQCAKTPCHLGEIRWDELERRGAVAYRVFVDFGDEGKVGLGGRSDFWRGHGARLEGSGGGGKSERLSRVVASGAKQSISPHAETWIASSLALLAMTTRESTAPQQKPRPKGRGSMAQEALRRSVALSEELQQQREQVDEVQVERQGAGDRRTFRYVAA